MGEESEKPIENEEKKVEESTPNGPIENPSGEQSSTTQTNPERSQESSQISPAESLPVTENGSQPSVGSDTTSPTAPSSETPLPEEKPEFNPDISAELEQKMQEELAKKKEQSGVKTVTRDAFIEYLKPRRSKVMYFALWHMAFNIDDHKASKKALYDALKEPTSTSPIEPLAEHKFYFGLKYILKLKLFDQPVVEYVKDKLKISVNIENLQEILKEVGEPISTRPVMSDEEKRGFIDNFLKDDFLDL
jgi:DNA mismatch repair ATPase MutL